MSAAPDIEPDEARQEREEEEFAAWVIDSLGLQPGDVVPVDRYLRLVYPSPSWQVIAWSRAYSEHVTRKSEAFHRMCRLLKADHFWSLAPFTPLLHDDKWFIACNADYESRNYSADILLIDPATGNMQILGDDGPCFYGEEPEISGTLRLWVNGIHFARAWAAERLTYLRRVQAAGAVHAGDWTHRPCFPGMAMLGDLARHRDFSALANAARLEIDNPKLVRPLSDAILRAARLPAVTAPALRTVA
jgi:hypothetical protein